MITVKNQKGYALLTVLMLVLLFTVLGMGLLAMNMNAAKQFDLKEEQVQARHQAEMGVLHYEAVLKEKIKNSSTTMLTCPNIETVLGNPKELKENNYIVKGAKSDNNSCELLPDGKKMEIKIKSTGTINNDTKKEVKATYYVVNTGGNDADTITTPPLPTPPLKQDGSPDEEKIIRDLGVSCNNSGSNCINDIEETDKFAILNELKTSTDVIRFKDNLVVKNIIIGGGYVAIIEVHKNLYISDTLNIQNHACFAVGGDFTVGKKILRGAQTDIFVYGNFFLPKEQSKSELLANLNDSTYVGGNVYRYNSTENVYNKVSKKDFGIKELSVHKGKKCDGNVSKYEKFLWTLLDETNFDYS